MVSVEGAHSIGSFNKLNMPLSGAERTQRYRNRLKQNRPEEYDRQKKLNLARTKSNKKKISELTPEEIEIRREKWRKAKRKSLKRLKKAKEHDISQKNIPDFQYVLRKGKGKKKRKSKPNTAESSDNSDILVEPINNELDETNSDQTNKIDSQNYSNNSNEIEYVDSNCGIHIDAQLISQPKIEIEDDAQLTSHPQIEPELEVSIKIELEDHELVSQMGRKTPEENPFLESSVQDEIYNTRALSQYAETYELETFEKKALIIFNQDKVDGYMPRHGTEKDVEALTNTFERFDFEVTEHKDFTKKEIFDTLETYFAKDFTDYGCVGIAVLTHGSNSGLLRAKDQQYSEIEIVNYFKVHDKPTLVTKPKFLIIQACRGTRLVPGAAVFQAAKIRTDMDASKEPYILPVEADLLILHSSFVGSPSHRHELFGSWFIQSLCNKINQLASTHDVESIITEVKRDVAIEKGHEIYNKVTYEMQVNKQMPVMTSTLIRKLYLKKFGDPMMLPVTESDGATCNSCKRGSLSDVLDNVPPTTPTLIQFGPCSCFLEHFDYIKKCLRYFVEEYPEDETAGSYLEVAETLEDGVVNATKEKLAKIMCKHLTLKAKHCQYYKYLYFYKHF